MPPAGPDPPLSMQSTYPAAPELAITRWFNTADTPTLADLRGEVVVIEAFQMLCPGCVSHGHRGRHPRPPHRRAPPPASARLRPRHRMPCPTPEIQPLAGEEAIAVHEGFWENLA